MDKIWKLIERMMHFVLYKVLRLKLSDETWEKLCQFVKFGIVGLSNTLISYVVYIALVFFSVYYLVASLIGFLVSVINAYYWNDRYVFKVEDAEKPAWWKIFLKTFMAYAGTGLILNNILLIFWVDIMGIHEMLGPILNLFITIPLNFLLNKYWAFKKDNKVGKG